MAILGRIKKSSNFFDFLNRYKKKSAIKIYDFLDVKTITYLNAKNRNDAILELVAILHKSKKLKEKEIFYKKIIEREKIVSTGIGLGVAVPHAKINDSDDFFIAIGIIKNHKINWNSIDHIPIRLIFMIGGPENRPNEYLQLLSNLTMSLRNDSLRRNILNANNEEEIFHQFRQI